MIDLISRQAAIDIERNATVDTNPSHFEAHQKFMQFMDDAEISSFGRWQWSNGFNTAITAVGIDLKKLPSAEPVKHDECEYIITKGNEGYQEEYNCSSCGDSFYWIQDRTIPSRFNYCRNCGRKITRFIEKEYMKDTATEKQIEYASYLAKRMCVELPKEKTKEAYSDFISKWKPAVKHEDDAMNEPDSWQMQYM